MIYFSRSELLSIILSTVTAFVALASLLFAIRQSRASRKYSEELKRSEIEIVRRSLEEQLYRINDRLTSSESRWRDVNHLVVSGQNAASDLTVLNEKQVPHLDFLERAGVSEEDFSVERSLVFVLMPFHPEYEPLYFQIQNACRTVGLTCLRGDEQYVPGDLLSHILKMIVKARLVVAVIDGRNPNVFYELGIAHALGKPVVILSKSAGDLPFDLRSTRVALYRDIEQVPGLLNTELTKLLLAEPN